MRRLFIFALLPLMAMLSACATLENAPVADRIEVGCATGPLLFPEYAEQIAVACALRNILPVPGRPEDIVILEVRQGA